MVSGTAANGTLCWNKTEKYPPLCLNGTLNGTYPNGGSLAESQSDTNNFSTGSVYFLLVLCTSALLENIFTCYIIYANKILQTATNTFVFSLCITDLLCAGVLVPISLFYKNSNVYLYFAAIIVFTYTSNLTAVTYERLISITKPLRYRSIITKQTALRITVAAWLVPISYCLVPLTWKTNVLSIEHKVYLVIAMLVFLISPLFFICFVYIRILIEVHRLLKEGRNLEVYSSQDPRSHQSYASRLMRFCCFLVRPEREEQSVCSNSHSRLSPNLHEDSNDELSCTFKTDLYYNTNSNQSLYGLRQDGRSSLSVMSRRSCDSGKNCPHGDTSERGQHLAVERAATPPTVKGAVHVCQSHVAGRVEDARCSESAQEDEKPHSTGEEEIGTTELRDQKEKKDRRNTADIADQDGEEVTKPYEASHQKEEHSLKNRVGFLIDSSKERLDDAAKRISDDVENGVSEHDSGIEEERSKDAMRMSQIEVSLNDENADDPRIDACPQPHPSPEPILSPQGKSVPNEGRFLVRLLKQHGTSEYNRQKARRRYKRSLRRRHVFEEVKASTAFALVAFTYMFTWIPVIYMTFMDAIDKHHLVSKKMEKVNAWTIAINAAVDPIFYALILRNFRKTIKRQVRRMKNSCN